jgi:DNA-binding MarR family transcriptional regulator
MNVLPKELQDLITSGPMTHLTTINSDGSPQVSVIWVGLDGDQPVSGHMARRLKLGNIERDSRVVLSFDAPRVLARLLELDKSSVTGLVDRAERRGLVERVPSPADRRAVLVRLADEGRSLVSEVSARFEADVSTMLQCLPVPDRDAMSGLVSRLLVAHATKQGVDLFDTIGTARTAARVR